jgi:hypothetical protein
VTRARRDGFGVIGIGAAACIACCAGPILGFLGGLGVVGLVSTILVGAGGLALTAVAVAGWIVVRRRRTCGAPRQHPVAVGDPIRRTSAVEHVALEVE